MKNYSQTVKDAIANDQPVVGLIQLNLVGGVVYLTTAAHDITYNGIEWISSGLVLQVADLSTDRQQTVQSVTVQFSAADLTIVALFTNNNQQNTEVVIGVYVLNDIHEVVGELYSRTYIVDSHADDNDDSQATISVELSNYLSNYEAVNGVRSTQSSFAKLYPSTTSFNNSKDIDKDLKWGGE